MAAQHRWQQPGERRQDRPVGPVRFRPRDLTPQHRDLMTEHHDLRVLGCLASAEQHQPAEYPDRDQVEQTKSHEPRSWRNQLIRPTRRSQHLRRVLKRYREKDAICKLAEEWGEAGRSHRKLAHRGSRLEIVHASESTVLRVLTDAGVHLPGASPREPRLARPWPEWAELVPPCDVYGRQVADLVSGWSSPRFTLLNWLAQLYTRCIAAPPATITHDLY